MCVCVVGWVMSTRGERGACKRAVTGRRKRTREKKAGGLKQASERGMMEGAGIEWVMMTGGEQSRRRRTLLSFLAQHTREFGEERKDRGSRDGSRAEAQSSSRANERTNESVTVAHGARHDDSVLALVLPFLT